METLQLVSDDGTRVFVYHWPLASPRAVVQIAHGAAEHARRYARLAGALNAAGYAVLANDHRGHGQTAAGRLGVFAATDGWNRAVDDLARVTAQAKERYPDAPLVLLGHSMGSLMAQQYLVEHGAKLAALALSGSTVADGFRDLVPLLQQELDANGREAPCELMGQLMSGGFNVGIEHPRTTHDWLSRDEDEVQAYLDDPLCGFELSVGAWHDLLTTNRIPERPEDFAAADRDLPIYVFAGAEDPVSDRTTALETLLARYAEAGFTRVTRRFYPGARHEPFNETNRDEVTRDLLAWLDQALQDQPERKTR